MFKVKLLDQQKEISPKKIQLGSFKTLSPVHGQEIENDRDLQLSQNIKRKYNLQNSSLHIINILNANRILTKKSQTLYKYMGITDKYKIDKQNALIIDPAFDYLYHAVQSEQKEFRELKGIPKKIKDILKGDNYTSKMNSVIKSPKDRTTIVDWAMTLPMEELGALFPLPPCPPIKTMKSLDWAFQINRVGLTVALDNGWNESAYFNLDSQKCFSDEFLQPIASYLKMNEEDVNTIVIKFRNGIRPQKPYEMVSYYNFIQRLKELRDDKVVILLNTDSFGCINIGLGQIDIFCEPFKGNVNKDIRFKRKKGADYDYDPDNIFGKWLNPKDWRYWDIKSLRQFVNHNKNKFSCNCPECLNVKTKKIVNDSYKFNLYRKKHNLITRDNQMGQFRENMMSNTLRGAFLAKLDSDDMRGSDLSVYKVWFS